MPRSETPGISWDNYHKKWRVQIWINGRQKHIGYYKSKSVAVRARLEAEARKVEEELDFLL